MEFLKPFERFDYVFQKKKMKCEVCLGEAPLRYLGYSTIASSLLWSWSGKN